MILSVGSDQGFTYTSKILGSYLQQILIKNKKKKIRNGESGWLKFTGC